MFTETEISRLCFVEKVCGWKTCWNLSCLPLQAVSRQLIPRVQPVSVLAGTAQHLQPPGMWICTFWGSRLSRVGAGSSSSLRRARGQGEQRAPFPWLMLWGQQPLAEGWQKKQLKEIMSFTSKAKFARCCRSASSLPSARRVPPRLCSSRSLSGGTTGSMDTVAQQMWPWGMFAVLGTPKCCCISYLLVPQIVALSITACGPENGTGGRASRILALD